MKILRVGRHANLNELNHTGVSELPQQCDLAKDAFAVGVILKDILHLLDSHAFAG